MSPDVTRSTRLKFLVTGAAFAPAPTGPKRSANQTVPSIQKWRFSLPVVTTFFYYFAIFFFAFFCSILFYYFSVLFFGCSLLLGFVCVGLVCLLSFFHLSCLVFLVVDFLFVSCLSDLVYSFFCLLFCILSSSLFIFSFFLVFVLFFVFLFFFFFLLIFTLFFVYLFPGTARFLCVGTPSGCSRWPQGGVRYSILCFRVTPHDRGCPRTGCQFSSRPIRPRLRVITRRPSITLQRDGADDPERRSWRATNRRRGPI